MDKTKRSPKKLSVPFISMSVNAWNRAAVQLSAENRKLPSNRKVTLYRLEPLSESGDMKREQLSTDDWNRRALARLTPKCLPSSSNKRRKGK